MCQKYSSCKTSERSPLYQNRNSNISDHDQKLQDIKLPSSNRTECKGQFLTKYAHMADVHIGSWRDPKLKDINSMAFQKAVDICLDENVEFVLISGDLFNTALPGIDCLKDCIVQLKRLKKAGIRVYAIPGSHDYSPSGRTMFDVIEEADLLVNVSKGDEHNGRLRLKFIEDKSGVKITGLFGRRAMLDKSYYELLDREYLLNEPGEKIFMFHTTITEFKPKEMDKVESTPVSLLPRGFGYYAGGHVHYVYDIDHEGFGRIAYPGPVFPNSFSEIEKLQKGGMYIVTDNVPSWRAIELFPVVNVSIDCNRMGVEEADEKIKQSLNELECSNALVTLRVIGVLSSGRPSEIKFKEHMQGLYDRGAYFVMRNINKLSSSDFEEIKVEQSSIDEIENKIIEEHKEQLDGSKELVVELMKVLSDEKREGENNASFELRISEEVDRLF